MTRLHYTPIRENKMSNKFLEQPDETLKEQILSEFGLNKEKMKEAVGILKKWMQQQPHLPEDYDDGRLERFLLSCKNSMEITKATIDLYYTIRCLCPELMSGWNVKQEWLQNIRKAVYAYPGSRLTSEGDRICFLAFTKDVDNFDFLALGKLLIMCEEIRKHEDYWRCQIVIMDLKNFSISHVPKITLPLMKKLDTIFIKAYKCRMKAMYMLNVPSYAEIVINLLKSVVKTKLASRIHIHGSDLTELHKQVPKELLPSDLGGEGESMAENTDRWLKEMESKREWLLERENIKTDETKRPGRAVDSGDIFGFDGTFRKLDVD